MEATLFQIPLTIDRDTSNLISSDSINSLFEQSEIQVVRNNSREGKYACYSCKEDVHLQARKNENSRHDHTYFFRHPPGTGLTCEWKTGGLGKGAIYNGVKEGRLHKEMKALIRDTLIELDDWKIIDIDKRFVFSEDRLLKGKPDIHAQYKGEDVVFEIQLRSEKLETIKKRKSFYKDKGWKLIWVSAEGSDIVSKRFSEDCLKIRQVHKDIAFLDRGNWFIFNKELSSLSTEQGKLTFLAKIWTPKISNNKIEYFWEEENIDIDNLTFEDGDTYFKDFYAIDYKLKTDLRDAGTSKAIAALKHTKSNSFDDFLKEIKNVWPTFDYNIDSIKLKDKFLEHYNERIITLKKQILKFFRSEKWRNVNDESRWIEISRKVKHLSFGIHEDNSLHVFEKLLLISGYSLSPYLNPQRKSHIQSCHYFMDSEKHQKFIPFQSLCELAIEKSPYRDSINFDKSIIKRDSSRQSITQEKTDIDVIFNWFISEPTLSLDTQ